MKLNRSYFADSYSHVDVKIRATHLNFVNKNCVMYSTDAARSGAVSWVTPFNKPILIHHDLYTDPIGRVLGYDTILNSNDLLPNEPSDYVELECRITNKDAIEKVLNGSYLTCSVGSSVSKVTCSACGTVISEEGLCEHYRGDYTDSGELIYWIIDEIDYKENSFVNNPADPYSRITDINLGSGYIKYSDYISDSETIINNFIMEDSMKKRKPLTQEDRQKLPASVFCGPEKTFPAHDKEHVEAGLKVLSSEDCKLEDSTKDKIKSALLRKGSRFGVEPTEDDIKANKDIIAFRVNDEFSDEEKTAIADFFKDHSDADLPVEEEPKTEDNNKTEDTNTQETKLEDLSKEELIAKLTEAQDKLTQAEASHKEAMDAEIEKNKSLSDEIESKDAILNSKEDEINKLIDSNASIELSYKKELVDRVISLTSPEVTDEARSELEAKYLARSIDSLKDTISDAKVSTSPETKVENPTLTQTDNTDDNQDEDKTDLKDNQNTKSRFSIFFES